MPNSLRKFTPKQVERMRQEFSEGTTSATLQKKYGVNSNSVFYAIVKGKTYKDVGGPIAPSGKGKGNPKPFFIPATLGKPVHAGGKPVHAGNGQPVHLSEDSLPEDHRNQVFKDLILQHVRSIERLLMEL